MAIMEGATAIMDGDGIIVGVMTAMAIAVMLDGIVTDAMTGIAIAVMFAMTTAGTITSQRFDRTSKIFEPLAGACDKTARTFVELIKS